MTSRKIHAKQRLEEISTISTGFSFRGAIPKDSNGDTFVVQAANLAGDGSLAEEADFKQIKVIGRASSVTVLENDVLLVSRGTSNGGFRAAFVGALRHPLIASSSLHIIRVKTSNLLPEFLCAYFNTPQCQQQLQRIASGSTIRTLLIKNLSMLEIPIPPIKVQQSIIELARNVTSQQKIFQQRNNLLSQLVHSVITTQTA